MYVESVGQNVYAAVKKCLYDLFEEYRNNLSRPSEVQSQASDDPPSNKGGESTRKLKTRITKKIKLNSGIRSASTSKGTRTELERYLTESCEEDRKRFDILDWWKGQSARFPILSALARDVLAIPISTVASESAFSTSGRILDDFRSSLTPFMVEALVFSQDWLRRTTPINVEENTQDLAKLEQELIQEFKDKAIVDAHAAQSQIQGSKKKMVTSTNISSQPSKSSKESKNKNLSKDK